MADRKKQAMEGERRGMKNVLDMFTATVQLQSIQMPFLNNSTQSNF